MPGCSCFSWRVATSPFMPGMEMSITTTSGFNATALWTAALPSLASATTVMSGWLSMSSFRP